MNAVINRPCDWCGGTGEVIETVHGQQGLVPCPDCDGKGWVKEVFSA